jgi:hypothetical protein
VLVRGSFRRPGAGSCVSGALSGVSGGDAAFAVLRQQKTPRHLSVSKGLRAFAEWSATTR